MVVTAVVGGTLGLVAGFVERWPSAVLMRLADVQLSFPFVLLAMTINAIVGLGLRNIILSLSAAGWVVYARVVRGEVLSIKQRDYAHAAAALGVGRTLSLTLDTPSGRYPLDKDVSLAIDAQLQRLGIKTNVVVNEWGTHLDKIKNRNTGDMFFLGWGPALFGQGTMEPLFRADQTYASYGNNKAVDEKIAPAVRIVDAKGRAAAYAELQTLLRDEAPWVFLWQQHDLYGVAAHVEWSPRADEKVWMYEARIAPR